MLLKNTSSNDEFEHVEPGSYAAVCYRIIDLGTQRNEYQGVVSNKRQMLVSWEINERMKDGKPFSVGAFYTQSLHEKATLRKHLEAWRGKPFNEQELQGFDPKVLLGKACMISVVQTKTGKTKVQSVSKLPKGLEPPALENEMLFFSLDNFDQEVFDKISNGLKALIQKSPEYQSLNGPAPVDDPIIGGTNTPGLVDEEDIPF